MNHHPVLKASVDVTHQIAPGLKELKQILIACHELLRSLVPLRPLRRLALQTQALGVDGSPGACARYVLELIHAL